VPGLSLPVERAAPGVQQEHGRADIAGAGHGRRGGCSPSRAVAGYDLLDRGPQKGDGQPGPAGDPPL
jgi:hypothetical protein